MKKIVLLLSVILLSTTMYGQFGIKAGMNFNSMNDINTSDISSSFKGKTGFHAGILYKLNLPLGFALQPELLYTQINGNANDNQDLSLSYLQLPVNIQWGIDLILFRPYLMVSPYVGYALSKGGDALKGIDWKDLNKLSYGVGLGAGLDIWKFQVSGRYCWDLGYIGDLKESNSTSSAIVGALSNGKRQGFELSLAFLF